MNEIFFMFIAPSVERSSSMALYGRQRDGSALMPFDLNDIQFPFRILILGPSQSGKTSIAHELMCRFQNVPRWLICSETEAANPKYKGIAPDIVIYEKYDHDAVQAFVQNQEELCYLNSERIKNGKQAWDTRGILMYDDLQSSASTWGKTELTRLISTAGRNYDMSWIVLFQSPIVKGIEADIRNNFTHVFFSTFDGNKEKAKLREYYCDLIPQHRMNELLNERLQKYEFAVYNRTLSAQDPIHKKICSFQARYPMPPFRVGHKMLWRVNTQFFDPNHKLREFKERKQQKEKTQIFK